jgi:hypothetical protein
LTNFQNTQLDGAAPLDELSKLKNLLDRAARDGEALDELSKINLTVLHLTNLLDGAAPLDDVRNNGLDCAAFERLPKKPN